MMRLPHGGTEMNHRILLTVSAALVLANLGAAPAARASSTVISGTGLLSATITWPGRTRLGSSRPGRPVVSDTTSAWRITHSSPSGA